MQFRRCGGDVLAHRWRVTAIRWSRIDNDDAELVLKGCGEVKGREMRRRSKIIVLQDALLLFKPGSGMGGFDTPGDPRKILSFDVPLKFHQSRCR